MPTLEQRVEQLEATLAEILQERRERPSAPSEHGGDESPAPGTSAADRAATCGRRAGIAGHPESACPFERGDPLRSHWLGDYMLGLRMRAKGRRVALSGGLTPDQRARRAQAREEKARERGRDAARRGVPRAACPYKNQGGSAFFYRLWNEGHDEVTQPMPAA